MILIWWKLRTGKFEMIFHFFTLAFRNPSKIESKVLNVVSKNSLILGHSNDVLLVSLLLNYLRNRAPRKNINKAGYTTRHKSRLSGRGGNHWAGAEKTMPIRPMMRACLVNDFWVYVCVRARV